MFVIRPIQEKDLKALEEFAHATTLGMISLPKDRSLLRNKILHSMHSFKKQITAPGDEFYLFALENTKTSKVGGICGIYAKTGIKHPIYTYRIETIAPKKEGLPLPDIIRVLHPAKETNGPSELCALFLSKELRKEHLGELLSRSRHLFISEHLYRFTDEMHSRLRGFINTSKLTSPFWDGCGKHFFNASFEEVQALHQKETAFIGKFLPKYPIYVTLLPKNAQYVIQKTHTTTKPALKMLFKEGFTLTDHIDVLEAGPVLASKTAEIFSVKNNTLAKIVEMTNEPINAEVHIISNTSLDFRACYGAIKMVEKGSVILSTDVAKALSVKIGDTIRFIKIHKR